MNVLQEDHLKKVVGLSGAISISTGQVVGAGIMTLTGVGIGLTGSSVVLAFLLAAVITIFAALPITYMAASLPTTGGNYQPSYFAACRLFLSGRLFGRSNHTCNVCPLFCGVF